MRDPSCQQGKKNPKASCRPCITWARSSANAVHTITWLARLPIESSRTRCGIHHASQIRRIQKSVTSLELIRPNQPILLALCYMDPASECGMTDFGDAMNVLEPESRIGVLVDSARLDAGWQAKGCKYSIGRQIQPSYVFPRLQVSKRSFSVE